VVALVGGLLLVDWVQELRAVDRLDRFRVLDRVDRRLLLGFLGTYENIHQEVFA
jgi:hypothetical protein